MLDPINMKAYLGWDLLRLPLGRSVRFDNVCHRLGLPMFSKVSVIRDRCHLLARAAFLKHDSVSCVAPVHDRALIIGEYWCRDA